MLSRATSLVAGGALLAGATFTGVYFHVRDTAAPLRGAVRVDQQELGSEVVVRVDSLAVPHIHAESLGDAFFAQGYLHAEHRLFQMEILRRTAQGRLAELFEQELLPADRWLRTLDLWRAAGRSLASAGARELELLEAYAAGVNAWLADHRESLPPEFLLLGFEPEPWSAHAALAVGKVMALDLSPWSLEIERYQARRLLDGQRFAFLEGGYPRWAPTILDEPVSVPRPAGGSERPVGSLASEASPPGRSGHRERSPGVAGEARAAVVGLGGVESRPRARLPTEILPGLPGGGASNAWALDGSRTSTGHPLLANDMHLGLRAPAVWYLVGIHAPEAGYVVAGLSIPGAPGVIVGYNRDVAWGFTNGVVDDMDFTVEEVDAGGQRYREGGSWRGFDVRRETIRVRGRSEPVEYRVRETVRGPLASDALPGVESPLSVAWTAARATTEFRGILAMNRARSAAEMDRAIRLFTSPQQNVVYATASDTVAYRLSGTVPLRRSGQSGSYPLDEPPEGPLWPGVWPRDRMPALSRARNGYVATANNLQAPDLYGVLGVDYPLPFRARRIVDRLSGARQWGVREMLELQRDTRSLLGDRLAERAVRAMRRAGLETAAGTIAGWDRRVDVDSRGAALFYLWLFRLRDLVAADEYRAASSGGGLPERAHFPDGALLRLLEETGSDSARALWADDVSTSGRETLAELEERAARSAVREAAGRSWGEIHLEVHAHPLGRVPWLDALFGFNVGPVPGPGGPHTVRPDDWDRWRALDGSAWRTPLESRHGPSERFIAVLDAERGSRGYFMLPTGQSGNPFSKHYRDMLPRWLAGELAPVPLEESAVRSRTVRTFRLVPRRPG